MDMPKILYWSVFICVSLFSFYLQYYKEYQIFGITILLLFGSFHLIVFVVAEKSFVEIRLKIREVISLIFEGINAVWKDKLIVMYVFVAIISTIIIVLLFLFFFIKKLFYEPRVLFKTFQRL